MTEAETIMRFVSLWKSTDNEEGEKLLILLIFVLFFGKVFIKHKNIKVIFVLPNNAFPQIFQVIFLFVKKNVPSFQVL